MNARARILAKLQASAPSTVEKTPDPATWYARFRPALPVTEKIERFISCMTQSRTELHAVTDDNWPLRLAEVLRARGIDKLLLGTETPEGIRAASALQRAGITPLPYSAPIETWKAQLFHDIPAGFTRARAGIAETGTLILWPDAQEPRLLSLVPPVHIALLDRRQIYDTFYEAMTQEQWSSGLPTNALLISGPSKTADIQQTLAYGAHGPKELIVLLKGEITE